MCAYASGHEDHRPRLPGAVTTRPGVRLDWTKDPLSISLTTFQQLIWSIDWSRTSLGPMQTWSRELRQAVMFMVADINPSVLYVGDDRTIIYNEAFTPLVGKHYPVKLGARAADVFQDSWSLFDRLITEQSQTGLTQVVERSLLLIEREGFVEETYYTWNLTPVIGDDGEMFASYGRLVESTREVVRGRRTACVEGLTQNVPQAADFDSMWTTIIECLKSNEKDVPLAMFYSVPQVGSPSHVASQCHLRGTIGVPENHMIAKQHIAMKEDLSGFAPAMLEAWSTKELVIVKADDPHLSGLLESLQWRGFALPPHTFVVVPVKATGSVAALMIIGVNPCLKFDAHYRTFINIVADVLAPEIAKLRLADEVERRTKAALSATLEQQKSQLKFSRFAERSFVGLAYANKDGNILFANDAWLSFTGLDKGVIHMSEWVGTVHEDDRARIEELWYKVSVLKESCTFQIRSIVPFEKNHMKSPNKTAMCAAYPDFDDQGNVVTVMGLVLDISEQTWTEKQLLARKEDVEREAAKFRNFCENSPHGVVRTDAEGHVHFANAAWLKFYELDRDQVKGAHPWLAHIDEEEHAGVLDFFANVRKTASPISYEFRKRRHSKMSRTGDEMTDYLWLLATGWSVFQDSEEKVIDHIMFWISDVTPQKAAAKILENRMEEAMRLKTQQERFVDMISHEVRNPLSAILHCGEEICDTMKRSMTAMDLLPNPNELPRKQGDLQSLVRNHINNALDAANTIMYCVQHQKQIVDDVLTLSKLDSDLLVVSPVPVQPAQLVQSALKIFEPELKSADIKLNIDIDESAQDTDADWILLDPNRFLQIVINLMTNAIKFTKTSRSRHIVVRISVQKERPPQVTATGIQMVPRRTPSRAGIANNTDNIPDISSDNIVYLCTSVSDTGRGLTESERAILFQRFAQASPKTHVEYGGSGLGLFISRQITEMLGGEIGVGSGPEGGATFSFYVTCRKTKPPRRASLGVESISMYTKTLVTPAPGTWVDGPKSESVEQVPAEKRPALPTPKPTTTKRKVLVVEDNLVNQKVLCKQLRNRGFIVEAANHGREALAALEKVYSGPKGDEQTQFDCVLCDIEMPVMDGIECVTEIRRLEQDGHFPGHVPIIGVTANVRSKQVNAAIDAGMDGVTTKPYRIDELIAHIDRVCLDTKNVDVRDAVDAVLESIDVTMTGA